MRIPKKLVLASLVALVLVSLATYEIKRQQAANTAEAGSPLNQRRVNAPYNAPVAERAIFWFGQVNATSNYTNVRLGYDDEALIIHAHVFDRQLWYDKSPQPGDLAAWDAVSVYLDLAGSGGTAPGSSSYHFVAQFNAPFQPRDGYQAAYRGNGAGWEAAPVAFLTEAGYRGEGFNNGAEARGWWAEFKLPFASLGLTSRPPAGTLWALAVVTHDRDSQEGPPVADQVWPETADDLNPSTWGQLHYGSHTYDTPLAAPQGTTTIRHGVNGASVADAHVGGHSICGSGLDPWTQWGDTNYAGYHQINIQNQWDVSDWPCYSKYYGTFPLDAIPAGDKVIISATLTINQLGNAGQGLSPPAQPSWIQVHSVAESWDEATITWNNAPLAAENLLGAWSEPHNDPLEWPGLPITWNVTGAVAQAHAAGEPLRLALYEADIAQHSGKYFYSSDAGEAARPVLRITWGTEVEPVAWSFLPLVAASNSR
ncbi:MAG: DNRLRE domain-containing protein [Candidatus Promineifilaceae bacterium]